MEKTVNIEMTETQYKKFEGLLDKTLDALKRLEMESPERQANIQQSQQNTEEIKGEIENQIKILESKIGRFQAV